LRIKEQETRLTLHEHDDDDDDDLILAQITIPVVYTLLQKLYILACIVDQEM
jgi:hypothetical protein